jgi:hypothetical protein
LAPRVADVLEAYLARIPPGSLDTRHASSGWVELTSRAVSSALKELRSAGPNHHFGLFFGQGRPTWGVGSHAFRFLGAPPELDPRLSEWCSSALALEFPVEALDPHGPNELADFVAVVAETVPFLCGHAGLSLRFNWTLGPQPEVTTFVSEQLRRYLALDPGVEYSLHCRVRGASVGAHWINLLGRELVERLGGAALLHKIPEGVEARPLTGGLFLRGAEYPPLGAVATGATDLGFLPDLERLLRPVRLDAERYLSGMDDRSAWVERLDERKSFPVPPWPRSMAPIVPLAGGAPPTKTPKKRPGKGARAQGTLQKDAISKAEALAVNEEYFEAFLWYRIAADAGSKEAETICETMQDQELVPSDELAGAYLELARWYRTGEQVAKDPKLAAKWLTEAAEAGSKEAEELLAGTTR